MKYKELRLTKKEMQITMSMWGMLESTQNKIIKKHEKGINHKFSNNCVWVSE